MVTPGTVVPGITLAGTVEPGTEPDPEGVPFWKLPGAELPGTVVPGIVLAGTVVPGTVVAGTTLVATDPPLFGAEELEAALMFELKGALVELDPVLLFGAEGPVEELVGTRVEP